MKCAPLKPMTIPRLELQAAVLGTRLMQMIVDEHSIEISRCFLWSDSKTVIKWITSKNRRYKPFVAHRIAEILAATKPSKWRWIPTQDNVVDEATRPNYQVNLSPTSRWLSGPEFLRKDENMCPSDPTTVSCHVEEDEEELQPKFAILVVSEHFINFTKFSSFIRLKRTIGWVVRFVNRCRQIHHSDQEHGLSAAEIHEAETMLCRQAQAERYAVELGQIRSGQHLAKGSALYKLSPYVDDSDVLRVSRRIDAASWLPYTTRRPIILPLDHPLTELIISYHHCQMKHQNIEATLCEIRHKFWIPRLRQVIRKIIFKCWVCKIARVSPVTPILSQLPRDRLTPYVRPFTYTGLDYFGPLIVTIGHRQEKRWVALFTCLVVRAIHLEVARDLSTDACIIAIRNFINRRGVPVRIRSDNGKNFVGADQVARRFPEVFECERIQDELSSRDIEWLFNCPNNPSEAGVWFNVLRVMCSKQTMAYRPATERSILEALDCRVPADPNMPYQMVSEDNAA